MSDEAYQHWRTHGGIFDLSDRTKLRVTGADRVRYLNGQVTANVMKLNPHEATPACVTTAKGKLSAEVFLTVGPGDAILVDADASLRESLLPRLERYIVADDVTIEDVTEDYGLLHFLGPLAVDEDFEDLMAEFPPPKSIAAPWRDLFAPSKTPLYDPGFGPSPVLSVRYANRFGAVHGEAFLERSEVAAALALAKEHLGLHVIPPDLAESIRIEAGIPRWGYELREDTLPPEAGLDRTHIDYAKGCYIGQEVISRIKSVGHVNRQLTGFVSASGEPLQAGWSVFAPGDAQKAIGELTSAAWSFALAKPVALGYLRRGSPLGALLARPAGSDATPVEVTPAELPLAVHFSSP